MPESKYTEPAPGIFLGMKMRVYYSKSEKKINRKDDITQKRSILLKINIPPRPNKRTPAVQPLPEPRVGRPLVVHEAFGDGEAEGAAVADKVVEAEAHVGAVAIQFDLILIGGHAQLDRLEAVAGRDKGLEPAEVAVGILQTGPQLVGPRRSKAASQRQGKGRSEIIPAAKTDGNAASGDISPGRLIPQLIADVRMPRFRRRNGRGEEREEGQKQSDNAEGGMRKGGH